MEGGNIGKLLIMEFADNEGAAFAEIMNVLQKYSDFCRYTLKDEVILSPPRPGNPSGAQENLQQFPRNHHDKKGI